MDGMNDSGPRSITDVHAMTDGQAAAAAGAKLYVETGGEFLRASPEQVLGIIGFGGFTVDEEGYLCQTFFQYEQDEEA